MYESSNTQVTNESCVFIVKQSKKVKQSHYMPMEVLGGSEL
jgi:hypothetical protein